MFQGNSRSRNVLSSQSTPNLSSAGRSGGLPAGVKGNMAMTSKKKSTQKYVVALLIMTTIFFLVFFFGRDPSASQFDDEDDIETELGSLKEDVPVDIEEEPDMATPVTLSTEQKERLSLLETRSTAVKDGMRHAWNGYVTYAWGKDELKPVSRTAHDDMIKMGVTIVDSLDTLYIMGLKDEYMKARDWTANTLSFTTGMDVSTFETTIRMLGGLLSTYDLTAADNGGVGDAALLAKAKELGNLLLPAFNTQSGYPYPTINLGTARAYAPSWMRDGASLSEIGTLQMEFYALSARTGDRKYQDAAQKIIDKLDSLPHTATNLFQMQVRLSDGGFSGGGRRVTMGARGDSFYEYLIKMYLLTNKKLSQYKRMYDRTVTGILDHLILRTKVSKLVYIAELESHDLPARHIHKMDHLVCFAAGMFALGAQYDPTGAHLDRQREAALGVGNTCHEMYARMKTGISPEIVEFPQHGSDEMIVPRGASHYILRPEAVEGWFYLYRMTGDPKYQEWGWDMFTAIEKHCRTQAGYSGIRDVNQDPAQKDDLQQSFFLAETLKYLYLLLSPDQSLVPLTQYVFNTEAHPIRMFDPLV